MAFCGIIERAILTPLNEDVDALNKLINDKYAFTKHDGSPTQHRVYYNADSVVHGEQHGIYPTEFLKHSIFRVYHPMNCICRRVVPSYYYAT
jgi:hypothetical protein